MKLFRSLVMLLGAVSLAACEKNAVQDLTSAVPRARIRFYNFGLGAPGVNFYANAIKMTAITSATGTEAVTGVAYGAVGSGGFYSSVDPGEVTLTGKIAAATDKDLAISSLTTTLVDGKAYSFYQSGPYSTATKTVDAFIVEDPFSTAVDFTQARVRFVNAVSNAAPLTLYVKHTTTLAETAIGTEVAYKGAGTFIAIPGGVYDISARLTGMSTNAIARTAVSFSAGKVYTVSARGDITITSATATNRPFLDNTANQ
ncbi:MAG: DUF4397 domain-containing protein [Gemmatimonadaceae bacterium]|nr:DUF4397 domain-containing protein [Gemmatimonadaceae bacterium]